MSLPAGSGVVIPVVPALPDPGGLIKTLVMRLSVRPQNLPEWIGLRANLVPVPLAYTQVGFILSAALLQAGNLGLFESLEAGPLSCSELARSCGLDPASTAPLLQVLVSAGLLRFGRDRFRLNRVSRKFLLRSGPGTMTDLDKFNLEICWDWMRSIPDFLRSGRGLQYHDHFGPREWELYQKAMYQVASAGSREFGRKTPVPARARRMLDIGGSHGLHSVVLCRNHPGLESLIMDLPQAIERAAPLLAGQGMGDRVRYQSGDIRNTDLGSGQYDLVLMSNLAHHFSRDQNLDLAFRVQQALRPGGYFIIQEFLRPALGHAPDMLGSVLGFFFALSSSSGTWSLEEIRSWQQAAGLKMKRTIRFLSMPGMVQVVSVKLP